MQTGLEASVQRAAVEQASAGGIGGRLPLPQLHGSRPPIPSSRPNSALIPQLVAHMVAFISIHLVFTDNVKISRGCGHRIHSINKKSAFRVYQKLLRVTSSHSLDVVKQENYQIVGKRKVKAKK